MYVRIIDHKVFCILRAKRPVADFQHGSQGVELSGAHEETQGRGGIRSCLRRLGLPAIFLFLGSVVAFGGVGAVVDMICVRLCPGCFFFLLRAAVFIMDFLACRRDLAFASIFDGGEECFGLEDRGWGGFGCLSCCP